MFQAVPGQGLGLHQSRQWPPQLVRVAGKYQCPQTRATHQQSTMWLDFGWFSSSFFLIFNFFLFCPLTQENILEQWKSPRSNKSPALSTICQLLPLSFSCFTNLCSQPCVWWMVRDGVSSAAPVSVHLMAMSREQLPQAEWGWWLNVLCYCIPEFQELEMLMEYCFSLLVLLFCIAAWDRQGRG